MFFQPMIETSPGTESPCLAASGMGGGAPSGDVGEGSPDGDVPDGPTTETSES